MVWLALALTTATGAHAETRDEPLPLTLDSGREVTALLRMPVEASGPLPVIMLFGGFGGAERTLDYIKAPVPAIVASFPYPYDAPDGLGVRTFKRAVDDFGQGVDDTFDGIAKLTAALRARPDVDEARMTIVGASAGAPFATISAARLDIPGLVIVQGFGELSSVIARQFDLKLVERYGGWVRPVTHTVSCLLVGYLDLPAPEDAARHLQSGQQVLKVTATDDERIPAQATEALWSAIDGSDARATRMDLAGDHLRGYGDPEIDRILKRAVDWMQAHDLLVSSVAGNQASTSTQSSTAVSPSPYPS